MLERDGRGMAHPVVHFEIAGVDGERSVAFYRDAFGWEIQGAACNAEEGGISGGRELGGETVVLPMEIPGLRVLLHLPRP